MTSAAGQSSWSVISTCLPKISSSSAARAAASMDQASRRSPGGIAGELPGEDAADPGVMGDLGDLGLDLAAGPAGLAAGQGGGQLIQLPGGLGQRGAVEAAGLMGVQLGGMSQDRPAPGA